MKRFTTRDMIILNNLLIILIMAIVLICIIFTADIMFIYMFVVTAPVALISILTLARYEEENK
jgi:hypothetical protein